MEVPPTVWADLVRIVLCFVAVVFCEKAWKWIQRIQINVEKPTHQVSLPELITNFISAPQNVKPEEENEKYVDVLEQCEVTRPKILAVSPWDPNKDAMLDPAGMRQIPDEWDSLPGQPTYSESPTEAPSYALTNGRGVPIVYDREGLSEAQQITLENLWRCWARNQRLHRERARQGSDNEKEKDKSPEESMQQESWEQDPAGRGRASIRACPWPGQYHDDQNQMCSIPGRYEDTQNPRPYDFITANVEEHYHGNRGIPFAKYCCSGRCEQIDSLYQYCLFHQADN